MPKHKQKDPIRNKDGNHVILICHKERQGHINSLKSLRENIKCGPFTLGWSIVLKFECKTKGYRYITKEEIRTIFLKICSCDTEYRCFRTIYNYIVTSYKIDILISLAL